MENQGRVSRTAKFSNFPHGIVQMSLSSEHSEMVKQPIRQNRLYKVLHKHLRIPPWVVRPCYRALNIAGSPTQYC